MTETWKEIKGAKKAYVSNMGRVKQYDKLITPYYDAEGYQRVSVRGIGRDRVHRIVARAFIPNPQRKPMVDHINNVKDDNRADNLQWVTAKENSVKAGADGLIRVKHRKRFVIGITVDGDERKALIFSSQAEAADVTGIREKDINKCLKNKRDTAGGWVFGYVGGKHEG